MGGISPEQNVEGTLIVSLYDAKQKTLVWRGIGQDTLSNNGNKNQTDSGKSRPEDVQAVAKRLSDRWFCVVWGRVTRNPRPILPSSDHEVFSNSFSSRPDNHFAQAAEESL